MASDRDKLRVLLLAEYDLVGGTRTYTKQLVDFYSMHCFDVLLVSEAPPNDDEMVTYCNSRGVSLQSYNEVTTGSAAYGRMPWRLPRERKLLNKFIDSYRPDLIVASVGTPGLYAGHLGRGRRSIYILHTYPELASSVWRRQLRKWSWLWSLPKDIHLVTVSKYARDRIYQAWGKVDRKHKIRVIYNTAGEPVAPHPDLHLDRVKVLTVGHVVDYKNPLFWIEMAKKVLAQVPTARFTWVGPGPLIEQCRLKIGELGLQDNVEFVGLSNAVTAHYQGCDIYVQPSKIESLGLSVLDAMRHSKPCIVSAAGGLPELIRDGETGWIVGASNADEFSTRVIELARHQDERLKMGEAARRFYAESFTPRQWLLEMEILHQNVFM